MKNFLFVFVVILLDAMGIPGGCQSCFHRTDDPDRVTVSRDKVYFKAEGGRTFIQVNSNRDWIVRSFDDWLSVDPMSGNKIDTIWITASSITETERWIERQGYFFIDAGDASASVEVYQNSSW